MSKRFYLCNLIPLWKIDDDRLEVDWAVDQAFNNDIIEMRVKIREIAIDPNSPDLSFQFELNESDYLFSGWKDDHVITLTSQPGSGDQRSISTLGEHDLVPADQQLKHIFVSPISTPDGDLATLIRVYWRARWQDDVAGKPEYYFDFKLTNKIVSLKERSERELIVSRNIRLSGLIFADFEHSNTPDSPNARVRRITRPGAILLANLDVSDIPDPLPTPLPDRRGERDAFKDDAVNADPDLSQLVQMNLHLPPSSISLSNDLVLRLDPADAARVRVFSGTKSGALTAWSRSFGARVAGSATEQFVLPRKASDTLRFRIEALTLPGDPTFPSPTSLPPLVPEPDPPGGFKVGSSAAAKRYPNEVWMELVLRDGKGDISGNRDVALFTIAPLMLLSNLQPTECVYVNYFRDENHPMVAEIIDALRAVFGATEVTFSTTVAPGGGVWFNPHKPVIPGHVEEAKRLYIIDSRLYDNQWVQDEFEIGYCWAPHAWMHVVLHCPRDGDTNPLGKFVIRELPSKDMGIFDGISKYDTNSINFAGNLEVSPPVLNATSALPEGPAGLAVEAHDPAHFGKILLGEGMQYLFDINPGLIGDFNAGGTPTVPIRAEMRSRGVPLSPTATIVVRKIGERWLLISGLDKYMVRKEGADLKIYYARVVNPDFKDFLKAQKVQPILGIDTSWLSVAHVDEIISFVPAKTGKNFKLLFASTSIATRLFTGARDLHNSNPVTNPITELFRGKRIGVNTSYGTVMVSKSIDVTTLLTRDESFNNNVQTLKLLPIKQRLKDALDLTNDDIIEIPIYFNKVTGALNARNTTVANTPGMVNLLVVDDHVIVPKPFGPRMKTTNIITILSNLGLVSISASTLNSLVGHWHWARRGTDASSIAIIYGLTESDVRGHTNNTGKFDGTNRVIKNWDRIWIQENNVDLLEAYVKVVLEEIGLTVHFVDDWDKYHSLDGEVHCATNVKRTPPEAVSGYAGPYWWDYWDP